MMVCNSRSYLYYLDKLTDKYNNTYHCSIGKNPINGDYSALSEEIETIPKAPKFKVVDEVRIAKYKNIFSKDYTINWSREIFVINYVVKTSPWTYKIKDSNGETMGSFYEKELLLNNL